MGIAKKGRERPKSHLGSDSVNLGHHPPNGFLDTRSALRLFPRPQMNLQGTTISASRSAHLSVVAVSVVSIAVVADAPRGF